MNVTATPSTPTTASQPRAAPQPPAPSSPASSPSSTTHALPRVSNPCKYLRHPHCSSPPPATPPLPLTPKRSGFLNPFLYSTAASNSRALTDITRGGATGCTGVNAQSGKPVPGGSVIRFASWNATVGWDPVTGLGVPDFERLLSVVTAG